MSEWQPIETAPPDGDRDVRIEAHFDLTDGPGIAYDDDTGEALYMVWFASFAPGCCETTHWMPLPAPPKQDEAP